MDMKNDMVLPQNITMGLVLLSLKRKGANRKMFLSCLSFFRSVKRKMQGSDFGHKINVLWYFIS